MHHWRVPGIVRYGLQFPEGATAADIELICFNRGHTPEQGGLGRFEHLRNAIDLLWNEPRRRASAERKIAYDRDKDDAFIWNEWTELMMRGFCENQEVIVAGSGGSWKTTCMALYFLCFWLSSPHNTRVILTSTTGDGLRARVWKEVVHFWRAVNVGNLVQSRTMIQFLKGDDGAGIYGIAVESDGNVEKAVSKIIGRHNTNMGVGIDEMPTVSGAIVEAAVNLSTGAERFELKGVGNPDSHFDPHGLAAEPADGWDSISVDTETWRTKRGGLGIHLNGFNSPRIGNDDKFPGLIRRSDLERTAAQYGEDSPQMWKQRKGFWAPEGITKTVISETMITKFKAKEKAIWVRDFQKGAGLDPAFEGGDRCTLRFGFVGQIDGGVTAVALGDTKIIKLEVTSAEPLHYQIVRQVKEECLARGIGPDYFALDSTGEGGALASIFAREWSPAINQVEFGGRASEMPVSSINPRPSYQEYVNRVTELWFTFRTMMQNGQIRGLDDAAAIEFTKRKFEMEGNRTVVESKKKMKKRTGKSPDLADATVVLCELFRKKAHMELGNGAISRASSDDWNRVAKKMQVLDDAYLVAAD